MKIGMSVMFGLMLASHASIAQQHVDSLKTMDLQEIVVTGTRTERDRASLPVPVQIVSQQNIRAMGVSRLNEVLQEQTGLLTLPTFGGGEGLQMQGLDAAYTMILIDGQPLVGRRAGTLDLSRISVHNIERIEIVKGASSSLYGSEALAGVINIVTKKIEHDGTWKGLANYRIARFGTHDISANVQQGKNNIGFDVFANYFASQGYNLSQNDFLQTVEPFRNVTFQPKISVKWGKKIDLLLNNRFYAQTQDHKASILGERYEGESNSKEWNSTLLATQRLSEKYKLVYDAYVTNYRFDEFLNEQTGELFEKNYYNQWLLRPEVRLHYKNRKHSLTAGTGLMRENLNRTYFSQKASLNSEYIFGQYEWFISEKWNVLLGFRYDHHQQYRSQFSPKIGVNLEVSEYFNLKTSLGYGYKAPDLRQLYFDFTNSSVGYAVFGYNVAQQRLATLQAQGQILSLYDLNVSTPLQPESSRNLNFGGFYQKGKITADFNVFYNQIENLIDTRAVARLKNGQNVFSYFNVDRIFTYGAELNFSCRFNEKWTVSAGYQYLVAKDTQVVQAVRQGKVFARNRETLASFHLTTRDYFGLFNRSRHLANVKVNYQMPRWKANVFVRVFYRSRFGLTDSNNNNILDQYDTFVRGYFLANIALKKDWKHGFSVQIGANNVLNFTDAANLTNIAGRQWFAKFQYNF